MTAPTKTWLAEQYHTGRFDLPNAHSHVISDDEKEALANAFTSLAIGAMDEKRLKKASLIARIQSQFPGSIAPTFADCVYQILAYHSTAPFYQAPSEPVPQSLSLLDLQRGLAWLLPDRHLRMSRIGSIGRMRTAADSRRLLFQSLATRSVETPDSPSNEAVRRRYAHRNAFDIEHVAKHYGWSRGTMDNALAEYAKTNRDNDGDEMYHDLLDVLQYNVPENYPYKSKRNDLRPLAKELKADFDFHSLAIPRVELAELVRALLALQFESAPSLLESVGSQNLDESLESVMAEFICNDNELVAAYPNAQDLVAWPAFDYGLQRLEHLFDPVHRVLVDALLDGKTTGTDVYDLYDVILPPELQAGKEVNSEPHVLSLGRMVLLHAILPPIIDWECCHTVVRWCLSSASPKTADVLPDKDVIWANIRREALDKDQEPSAAMILAFNGNDLSSGERFTGGVVAASDFYKDEGRELVYSLHVFQLAPSIRYAKLLDQEWRQDSDGALIFGDATPSSRFGLRVDTKVAELELPALGQSRTIGLDSLEIWNDSGIAERFVSGFQNQSS